jgi:hypothetical protein
MPDRQRIEFPNTCGIGLNRFLYLSSEVNVIGCCFNSLIYFMPRRIENEITLKTILKFYDTSHFLIIIENCKYFLL